MLIHYFAFGSNMARARLLARIPNAAPLGRGRLDGWRFACNKKGHDGSAKANIQPAPADSVWGVVYRMPRNQLPRLDAFEGGYERIRVEVVELAHPSGRIHCENVLLRPPPGTKRRLRLVQAPHGGGRPRERPPRGLGRDARGTPRPSLTLSRLC
ncbi:MAG TPA: gamma-glutamylcyclotransferase [Polyangiaceae bacterium]|nr:gamma-glutamylcyclotransferase [Polyangiaceae bacterium]